MNFLPEDYHTYLEKRECLNCHEPIPDQEHGARQFCYYEKMQDGTIKSCKDDYNSQIRKEANLPYKRISDYHKAAHDRLMKLWSVAREGIITNEQLCFYEINLHRSFEFTVDDYQVQTYYFVEFAITPLVNKQLKIFKHGRPI